jgi:hypothetical protein
MLSVLVGTLEKSGKSETGELPGHDQQLPAPGQ